jgi:hypothetical protein
MAVFVYLAVFVRAAQGRQPPKGRHPLGGVTNPYNMGISSEGRQFNEHDSGNSISALRLKAAIFEAR